MTATQNSPVSRSGDRLTGAHSPGPFPFIAAYLLFLAVVAVLVWVIR